MLDQIIAPVLTRTADPFDSPDFLYGSNGNCRLLCAIIKHPLHAPNLSALHWERKSNLLEDRIQYLT